MQYLCCNKPVSINTNIQLLTNPPKYKGVCEVCGKVFYVKVSN